MQDISQRGHWENDENVNDGNFKQIINLIARHDAVVKKKMDQSAQNAKHTSNTIQNEILDTLAYMVRDSIVEDVKDAQYFSLIADETKDVSKTEIISIIIRYYVSKKGIQESFIEFQSASDLSAKHLSDQILDCVQRMGFDVGQ